MNKQEYTLYKARQNKLAFSLVEIIITISIITLLAVIGFSSKKNYDENMNNTKVISDMKTINNALESIYQENQSLPIPDGNTNFYKIDTSYVHSYDDIDIFGVYGSISQNTISKQYLDILPLDPRTNSYYAYGKTKKTNKFEVASFQVVDGYPVSKVIGNYVADDGPYNLIREYNGPNFVYNNSKSNLPYNPYELQFVGKISEINGNVEIITKGGNIITNNNTILNYIILIGDKINVDIGSTVQIHFSDGSVSVIGDKSQPTKVTISDIHFKGKDNLSTFVKLYLGAGTIWTKATHLDEQSEFEVYTSDLNAAVRGTIFGVLKDSINTNVIVLEGEVDISRNGTYFETLKVELGDTIKKIEVDKNTNETSEISTSSLPDFGYSTDIRSVETVENINNEVNIDVSDNNINENKITDNNISDNKVIDINVTNNNISNNEDDNEDHEQIILNGNGCDSCPNGYIKSGENRLGISCKWRSSGSADQKVCKGVYGTDNLEVICGIEKPKTSWFSSGCKGWNFRKWSGVIK